MGVFLLLVIIVDTSTTAYLLGKRKQDKAELRRLTEQVKGMGSTVDGLVDVFNRQQVATVLPNQPMGGLS